MFPDETGRHRWTYLLDMEGSLYFVPAEDWALGGESGWRRPLILPRICRAGITFFGPKILGGAFSGGRALTGVWGSIMVVAKFGNA